MPPTKARSRIFPRWMVALFAILAVGWLLYLLRGALTPVFFAFLIAYMLDPVIDRFEARGHSRAVGIAVMLTVVLGGLALFMALVLPGAVRDLVAFVRELPGMLRELLGTVEPWLNEMGISVPHDVDEAITQFQVDVGDLAKQAALPLSAMAGWLLGETISVMGALAGMLLVPVFAAYLLIDFDRITAGVRDLIPPRYRDDVVEIARDVDGILGEFIRGQLIVMLILAVLYAVTYSLLGVRLAILIGVTAGLLSFIPYVGGGMALILGVVMALIYGDGWGQLVGVIIAYTIIQVLEGFVITPKVVGDKVGLSAVWVLFALMVGGEVFGFMGILLALPAAAVIKIFVVRGLSWYRASALFLGDDEGQEGEDEGDGDSPSSSLIEEPAGGAADAAEVDEPAAPSSQ
ncbi:MAG: AI-2E family transporter [Myxococcales bacterium]|nr:AI-2E family transporter [Myxococcales bacterium]MCB9712315.1 AI-2E family transporter [Myxococcales bacterium]